MGPGNTPNWLVGIAKVTRNIESRLKALENLKVYQVVKEKVTAKGQTRRYTYWHASWREGDRIVAKYLGSAKRMTKEAALQKAKAMKAEALGL